ncbi:MAG: 4-hydroxy-tetrahydrodipicolinate reductase [Sphingobacteriales bacterium]|jgi:4-hydroxy-tetrahydrodipicolinate reductase
MKIALIGYGKMGKEIEKIALERNHDIGLKITANNLEDFTVENLKKCDVAIDFSLPTSAVSNIQACFNAGTPVVVGTTGWYDSFEKISSLCADKKGGLFYATNFSVGVNLFFKMNAIVAKMMNNHREYDVKMEEIHHLQKLDHPSGTGITLAEKIIEQHDSKAEWIGSLEEEKITPLSNQLHIKALREHNVPGTHSVSYTSEIDTITLTHEAHSRKGFAMGAVLAAEFMPHKNGIFNMNDLLNL